MGSQVPQVSSIRNFPLGFKSAINAVLALIRWKSSIASSILAKSPSDSWEKGRVTYGTITSLSFPQSKTIDLDLETPKTRYSTNSTFACCKHVTSAVAAMASKCRTAFVEPPGWNDPAVFHCEAQVFRSHWALPKAFTTTMAFSKDFLVKISEGLKFLSSMACAVQLLLRFALLLPVDKE